MKKKIYLIEKYLDNEINDNERVEFDVLLKDDLAFKKEFNLRKRINHAIQESDVMDLRGKMNGIINEKASVFSILSKKAFYIPAAAILLLFMLSSVIYFQWSSKPDTIFRKYYSAYPAFYTNRSVASSDLHYETLARAFNLYENKDYNSAYILFKDITKKDSANTMALFYLSICALETNQTQEAIIGFRALVNDSTYILWEEANWYLAMAYIHAEKTSQAKEILIGMVQNKMNHHQEAKKIIRKLR